MDQHYNILLVDDDLARGNALAEQLTFHENYTVTQVDRAVDSLNAAIYGNFDLILLEGDRVEADAFDICHKIRKAHIKTPLILLSPTGDLDTVPPRPPADYVGLGDVVPKPLQLGVLLAKIRAQLRP